MNYSDSDLYKLQGKKCFYCGGKLGKSYTRDHFFPKAKGFTLDENKVLACKPCNCRKGHKMPSGQDIQRFNLLYFGVPHSPLISCLAFALARAARQGQDPQGLEA